MTKTELKKTVVKIKKFLKQRDYGNIDTGIELARALDEPAVFETLLEGCSIDKEGKLVRNKIFTGTGPAQPYLDYALLNLIVFAPENTELDESLKRSNIKSLSFSEVPWQNKKSRISEVPSSLANFTALKTLNLEHCVLLKNLDNLSTFTGLTSINLSYCTQLKNLDGLSNCTKLTNLDLSGGDGSDDDYLPMSIINIDGLLACKDLSTLDLSYCHSLKNLDGIVNCTKLTELDMEECISIENIDGLEKCTELTHLSLRFCESLKNLNGLVNCTKLEKLDLSPWEDDD